MILDPGTYTSRQKCEESERTFFMFNFIDILPEQLEEEHGEHEEELDLLQLDEELELQLLLELPLEEQLEEQLIELEEK